VEAEHQEHLGGPPAEPFHGRQAGDYLFVGQVFELVQNEPAILDARAEIAQVADLLSAQPGAAQRRVALRPDCVSRRDSALGKQRHESTEDRGRGLGRQLLADDRSDERRQMIAALPIGHQAWTDLLDRAAENRVAAHQQPPRAFVLASRHRIDA